MAELPPPILRQLYHAGGDSRATTGSVLLTHADEGHVMEKYGRLDTDLREVLSKSEFHLSHGPRSGLIAELLIGPAVPRTAAPAIRVGYADWRFGVGHASMAGVADSDFPNPVTSLLSAGLAASEVFRIRFGAESAWASSEEECNGDLRTGEATAPPPPDELDFGGRPVPWIGCGSIAFAAAHALDGVRRIVGGLHLVDPSRVNRSNTRKYLGAGSGERGKEKAAVLAKIFRTRGIGAKPFPMSINEYGREARFDLPVTVCCTDSSIARRDLQAKLPKVVLNGWTGGSGSSLFTGTSRHLFDGETECLNCAYWADVEGSPSLVDLAGRTDTDSRSLFRRRREGGEFPKPRREGPRDEERFLDGYFNACERLRLSTGNVQRDFSVPFVAAIGGALLASAIIAEGADAHAGFRLRGDRLSFSMAPGRSVVQAEPSAARKGCICQDQIYRAVFQEKWGSLGPLPLTA
jgi:hypothetical protein